MNKIKIGGVLLVFLFIVGFLVASSVSAEDERTMEQRLSILETKVAAIETCLDNVCTLAESPETVAQDDTFMGGSSDPAGTSVPTGTSVSPTNSPTIAPTAASKVHCNQGVGNGPEGCDPGNSNHNQPSNDENPNNRGGKKVP